MSRILHAMPELPSGTVTLLFTDIEGSTRLLQELGEQYAGVLDEHRRLLRAAFSRHGGIEVDTQGDAFFVAFARAGDAVAAAGEAESALAAGPVRVRIGIHTGEPLVTDEGYVGIDVHRAARIMGAAHGGQVLLSETTRPLLDPTVRLHDLGEHRLKDLTAPQRLYQLGDDEFPPPRTLHRTNLPIQPSALVGRDRELEEAGALLRSHRLVTLTGPGGSGKTRLALQLAADAVESFPDGVFWVPLQALRDPLLVERAIAASVGADERLVEHVGNKSLLLLLDNFEKVVDAAPTVAELLAATPNAKLLVTSREPLRIESERRYPVEPLPDHDAVALFADRAQGVLPGFDVTPAVQRICRRLDGLPLAIELAAARVALLDPTELLARLERRLPLLKSGSRDAPERQRTLRDTIAWSYELLEPEEQELFRRLGVFRGSFSLEAAEAICGADLDLLESLVVKSLVRRWSMGRLGMLDTIREYAVERVEEAEEMDDLRRRHAQFFLELAESTNLNPSAYDPTKPIRHDLAQLEENELYAALAWALETGSVAEGLRLATTAGGWLWSTNRPDEGVRFFRRLLEHADVTAVPAETLADAFREYGAQAFLSGEIDAAERLTQQSLALYDELGDEHGRAVMLHRVGLNSMWSGDLGRARSLVEESHAIHERRNDRWGVAQTLGALGAIAREEGDENRAYELLTESGAIAREFQAGFADWWAAGTLAERASLALNAGRLDDAETHAREALSLADRLHDRAGRAFGVGLLAAIAAARGQYERARRLWPAVEHDDAVFPLGGWQRHRRACEALIVQAGTLSNEAKERLTLEEAVRLALEPV
jgi:predicted ATPase/class 3 adenylate cyclase